MKDKTVYEVTKCDGSVERFDANYVQMSGTTMVLQKVSEVSNTPPQLIAVLNACPGNCESGRHYDRLDVRTRMTLSVH